MTNPINSITKFVEAVKALGGTVIVLHDCIITQVPEDKQEELVKLQQECIAEWMAVQLPQDLFAVPSLKVEAHDGLTWEQGRLYSSEQSDQCPVWNEEKKCWEESDVQYHNRIWKETK